MNVLSDAFMLSGRKVIVDDVLDVCDIKATSGNTSGDQDGTAGGAEGAPGLLLALHLSFLVTKTYKASSRSR